MSSNRRKATEALHKASETTTANDAIPVDSKQHSKKQCTQEPMNRVAALEKQIADQKTLLEKKETEAKNLNSNIAALTTNNAQLREYMNLAYFALSTAHAELATANRTISEKDAKLIETTCTLIIRNAELATANRTISEKDIALITAARSISEKNTIIAEQERFISEQNKTVNSSTEAICNMETQLVKAERIISKKSTTIAEMKQEINFLHAKLDYIEKPEIDPFLIPEVNTTTTSTNNNPDLNPATAVNQTSAHQTRAPLTISVDSPTAHYNSSEPNSTHTTSSSTLFATSPRTASPVGTVSPPKNFRPS